MKEVSMSGSRSYKFIFIAAVLLPAVLLGMLFAFRVSAAPNDSLPPLSSETGSLTVTFVSDDGTAVPNAEIQLVKVADFSVSDGKGGYRSAAEFASLHINYADMSTDRSIETANKVYRLVQSRKIHTDSAKTDTNGKARFTGLKSGMYEVFLGHRMDYNGKTYYFDPYLIAVPEAVLDSDGSVIHWKYQGIAVPKSQNMKEKADKPTPVPPPIQKKPTHTVSRITRVKTGDKGNPVPWICLIAAAAAGIVCMTKRKPR